MLGNAPVVLGERRVDWELHLSALLADLAPEGAIEVALVGRIAACLWRIGRVLRYETGVIINRRDPRAINAAAGLETGETLNDLRRDACDSGASWHLLHNLPRMDENRLLTGEAAADALFRICEVAHHHYFEVDLPCLPADWGDRPFEDCEPWTAGLLRACISAVAAASDQDAESILMAATQSAAYEWHSTLKKTHRARAVIPAERRQRLLPLQPDLDKIQRYESHLERCLYRALHELERLQGRRLGGSVPAPAVLDVMVGADP